MSSYVFSVGFAGDNKFLASLYAAGPITDISTARLLACFPSPTMSFASRYWSRRSTYSGHRSTSGSNGSIFPKVAAIWLILSRRQDVVSRRKVKLSSGSKRRETQLIDMYNIVITKTELSKLSKCRLGTITIYIIICLHTAQ